MQEAIPFNVEHATPVIQAFQAEFRKNAICRFAVVSRNAEIDKVMVTQEGLGLLLHGIQIEIQGTALPAEVTQKSNRAGKNRILVIPAQGVVSRMEIRRTRFEVTNADKPLRKPINRADNFCAIYFAIEIKMHALPAGMHARIGTARARNAHWRTKSDAKRLL